MLGLDVSSSSVKLVELSRGSSGQFTLERCAMEPLERGWITDGNIEKYDAVIAIDALVAILAVIGYVCPGTIDVLLITKNVQV